jgi:DNA-binding NarL/FixJ family response regulator
MKIMLVKPKEYEEAELKEYLCEYSCEVLTASDRSSIFQTLAQNQIDAVLYCLSCIDDFTIIRYINHHYPAIKVVISGDDKFCDSIENVRYGKFTSLRHPYRLNQLNSLFFSGE